jgi:3-oxoacyl-ACP reductase-like protein
MGKAMSAKKAEKSEPAAAPAPAPVAAPVAPVAPVATGNEAPGSAGPCKLYDTPDRDAAMIMAIVADQMGKPLNELRFKSIKEVK